MSELGIFYPNVPTKVKTETFTGTISNPIGNADYEYVLELFSQLGYSQNYRGLVTIDLGEESGRFLLEINTDGEFEIKQAHINAFVTLLYLLQGESVSLAEKTAYALNEGEFVDISSDFPNDANVVIELTTW